MSGFQAFEVTLLSPDVLMLRELPYAVPGWIAAASGAFLAIFAGIRLWFGLSRATFAVLCSAGLICILFGIYLIGLEHKFSFQRANLAIQSQTIWFGRVVNDETIRYTTPPVADIIVTKRTTNQLVLRFPDGRVEKLGLSTDRQGYAEVVDLLNAFFQGRSIQIL